MNFQELGLTLQREREAKGLTIEAVMEATKISRINLVAIENGDRSSLPHPVYTKGFVKSYARLLGLDADELSMVVDREYLSEEKEVEEISYDVSPAAEKAFHEADAPAKCKRPIWPSILIAIAVVVAAVLIVLNLNKGGESPELTTESAQVTEQQAAPEEEVEHPVVPEPEAAPAVESAPAEEVVPAEEVQEVEPEAVAPAPVEQQSEAAQSEELPVFSPESAEPAAQGTDNNDAQYAHVLIIRATTNKGCWIGLWKGDEAKMARDFVLTKGEPLRLMFNNPRRIRIGNVAGVEVTYNGKPYPLEDNTSNIQTLVFGKN